MLFYSIYVWVCVCVCVCGHVCIVHICYWMCQGKQIWCIKYYVLCSVDCASRYNREKKNQLNAQLILSMFRQPLHVSGISRPHHEGVQPYVYNIIIIINLLSLFGDCLLSPNKNNKYQLLYTYGCTSWCWAKIRSKHVEVDKIYQV